MRILYITNGFPYPLTSGYLRHYFLIKELAPHFNISLLSIAGASFRSEHVSALEPYTERVLTFATRPPRMSSSTNNAMRQAISFARDYGAAHRMGVAIRALTHKYRFDAVVCSGKRTLPALHKVRELPMVIDICDAASLRILGSARYARGLSYLTRMLQYLRTRRTEQTMVKLGDHLLFASCRDRDVVCTHSVDRTSVVPNGVDVDYWRRSSSKLGRNTIVLTGAMHYGPNWDAAIYLIEQILPRVRKGVPDVKLLVVGKDPHPRLLDAGKQKGVEVTGFVHDVRPYLDVASVFAAPLRFGAGVQNKILEAMAAEIPVVTTPLAANGLHTEESATPPIEVASKADEFAELVTRRLIKQGVDRTPHAEGRCFVKRHFVWERSGQKLEHAIHSAIAVTQRRAAAEKRIGPNS